MKSADIARQLNSSLEARLEFIKIIITPFEPIELDIYKKQLMTLTYNFNRSDLNFNTDKENYKTLHFNNQLILELYPEDVNFFILDKNDTKTICKNPAGLEIIQSVHKK